MDLQFDQLHPGVWRSQVGSPGHPSLLDAAEIAPSTGALAAMGSATLPFASPVTAAIQEPRTVIRLPLAAEERIYGLGLQFKGLNQRGRVHHLHVDHYGDRDNGRTHAPVPMYVSSAGYAVLIDCPHYLSVYVGTANPRDSADPPPARDRNTDSQWTDRPPTEVVELSFIGPGATVLVFGGPTVLDAVRRYVLYCGGGCLPPRWGLGFWHRLPMLCTQEQAMAEADEFAAREFPLDVIGLEPGWHSKSYPCTFEWDTTRFPDPTRFLGEMRRGGVRVNLWENAYVSPDSPLHPELAPLSGSHLVWCGLVPDYSLPEARHHLQQHHEARHLELGVSGYKIDECDGFDQWLWPDHATFPSGLGGEHMRQIYALLLQRMFLDMFRGRDQRTYGLTRATNAGSPPLPFVLYSDHYGHREFITALITSGLTGLLWTPEARSARDGEEWLRRLQSTCFSPLSMINAWADGTKPWSFPEVEDAVRQVMQLRLRLLPYLYSAFARYHFEGMPPFRAMVMEPGIDRSRPADAEVTDQYMMGDHLLVAPMFAGERRRSVLLPAGKWYDFHTGALAGEDETITIEPSPDTVPLYVRDGGIIPLMPAALHVPPAGEAVPLEIRHYGTSPGSFRLYDDDGQSFAYERGAFGWTVLTVEVGDGGCLKGRAEVERGFEPSSYSQMEWRFMS